MEQVKCISLQAAPVDGERKPKVAPTKKPSRPPVQKQHRLSPPDGVCFICGKDEGRETACCSHRRCSKIYHLACLNPAQQLQGFYTVSQKTLQIELKHTNSILKYLEYFCQMTSNSILIILSYTVSKLVHFF